jgi:peptidoglycan/LPS O-acetylase OafA/YrhL
MTDTMKTADTGRPTFHALDLLRGVAAILVVLYHKRELPLTGTSVYLSVDLFFLLSGVVVTSAYAERMAAGWSVTRFMLVRVIRLWPLYMLGTLISLMAALLSLAWGVPPFWNGSLVKITLFAFFFLPGVHQWQGIMFPLNAAAWSLFAELVVNLFFAIIYRARLARLWPLFTVLAAALLGFEIYHMGTSHDLDIGAFNVLPGVARALFSFSAGVLVYQAWKAGLLKGFRLSAVAALLAFLAMILPIPTGTRVATVWALLTIGLGFPVLVALATNARPGPAIRRWSAISGRLSYPVYTIHLPAFTLLEVVWGRQEPPAIGYWLVGVAVLAVALPLDRYVDAPIRRRLSRWLNLSVKSVGAAKPL